MASLQCELQGLCIVPSPVPLKHIRAFDLRSLSE